MLPNHKNIVNLVPPKREIFEQRNSKFHLPNNASIKVAYGGTSLVSMAIPSTCLKYLIFDFLVYQVPSV